MADKENDPFAATAANQDSNANRYEIDLNAIPTTPQEVQAQAQQEDPAWDINASDVRNSEDFKPNPPSRPRREPISFDDDMPNDRRRPERTFEEFDEGRNRRQAPDRSRYNDPQDDDLEDEPDYDDADLTNEKWWAKFKPQLLLARFTELEKKKKIMVAAVAAGVLIVLIIILSSIFSAIGEAVNQNPAPEQSNTAVPSANPTEPSTDEPEAPVETWKPKLRTEIGVAGITVDGAQITADRIDCDVVATDKNGAAVDSEEGTWCVLKFTAKNLSASVITIASQQFVLVDIYGEETYKGSTKYGDVGGGNVIAKIAPQEAISGFVYFDVPLGIEVSDIKMSTFGNAGGVPIIVNVEKQRPAAGKPTSTPTPNPTETSRPTPSPTPDE